MNILAFSGSTRAASWNTKLVELAAQAVHDMPVTLINLRDFELPLFNEDLEEERGTPEAATRLKSLFLSHQGLLISSPEYNSSLAPVLKNALDWVSRPAPGETSLAAFRGKAAALLSASPGALGGMRGLVHLRAILGNVGVIVLPDQVAVGSVHEQFHEDGSIKDEKLARRVQGVGTGLATFLRRHHTA